MTKKLKKLKSPGPLQIYQNNLWGGKKSKYYSGLGSHHPETVNSYIAVITGFLKVFETPLLVLSNLWRYFRIITGLQLPHYHE